MDRQTFEEKILFLTSRNAFVVASGAKKLLSDLCYSLKESDKPYLIFSIRDGLTKGIACFTRKNIIIVCKKIFGQVKFDSLELSDFIYFREKNNSLYLYPKKYGERMIIFNPSEKKEVYLIVKRLSGLLPTENAYDELNNLLNSSEDKDMKN